MDAGNAGLRNWRGRETFSRRSLKIRGINEFCEDADWTYMAWKRVSRTGSWFRSGNGLESVRNRSEACRNRGSKKNRYESMMETMNPIWKRLKPFGSAPMTPELRGLIATLRWDSPRWLALTVDRIRAAYALPPGENRATPVGSVVPVRPGKGHRDKSKLIFFCLGRFECLCVAQFAKYVLFKGERCYPTVLTSLPKVGRWSDLGKLGVDRPLGRDRRLNLPVFWPVSIAVPVGGARRAPNTLTGSVGDRALEDEIYSMTHRRRRRSHEEINSVSSNSPSSELPPPLRASDEGTSQVDPSARLSDVQKTSSWRFLYDDEREVEVEGLKEKLVATEAEKVALQTDLDLMKEKHRREIEGCKETDLKERSLARRSLAQECDAVHAVVKDKLRKRKEETDTEVRARIEALTEYSEGGFELEEELGRLKDREISLDLDYGVASVSEPSLSRLDLPEVSGDSVDQE
ncbi:LOW QUALITY PROTEIN: hypothetical protein HID58_046904 [Brassica napus]|uniref:Uncharacterized protein n=1 Tax=Brassica napus TaxID=3708 RepID=A0ABQ8AZ76_BRANA|nr:LOW QUALITY PROTEIN: hypothetical protein HID58_046904 [Brassica napus]